MNILFNRTKNINGITFTAGKAFPLPKSRVTGKIPTRKPTIRKRVKTETRDKYFSLNLHKIQARSSDYLTFEEVFPVLEANVSANDSPQNVAPTLPNKKRLTPLSIMVCDTTLALRSRTILKVLFDPESTVTFISCKCLPRHCKPCPVRKRRSVNTLAGSCKASEMVVLRAILLPELNKNRVINQHKALVFDGDIRIIAPEP